MCSIINPALLLLMKHLVIGQLQKDPNFSAFHWSPHGSLVFHRSVFRNHKGSTFYEKGQNKFNYRIRQKRTLSPKRTRLCWPCIAEIAGFHDCLGQKTFSLQSDNKLIDDLVAFFLTFTTVFQSYHTIGK